IKNTHLPHTLYIHIYICNILQKNLFYNSKIIFFDYSNFFFKNFWKKKRICQGRKKNMACLISRQENVDTSTTTETDFFNWDIDALIDYLGFDEKKNKQNQKNQKNQKNKLKNKK